VTGNGLSAVKSSDKAAGCQYRRINSPQGVLRPVCVNKLFCS
jgi:hypothetical protein